MATGILKYKMVERINPQNKEEDPKWYAKAVQDRTVDFEKLRLPVTPEDERTMLMREIMRLPRRQMEAVLLRYYMEIPQAEIARMLHISEAAVSKRLLRARETLRTVLKGGETDE